jgi:hydrogenase maturation protein HypF
VGFRPYVAKLASELGLGGSVYNSRRGVVIEIEGSEFATVTFIERLRAIPLPAIINSIGSETLPKKGSSAFNILRSDVRGSGSTLIPVDLAPCSECLGEMLDPRNRRYLYPFITCAKCGPRFSILRELPFDRARTSMAAFTTCPDCAGEYADPQSRRFHAETISCGKCGPQVRLESSQKEVLATGLSSIHQAVEHLKKGAVVAFKGIGGYQLLVDASNDSAIDRLRISKHRPGKPLAVLFPSLDSVSQYCEVSEEEAKVLLSMQRPIVLLAKRLETNSDCISHLVAPYSSEMGVMLAASPLHGLLLAAMDCPVVATSGNRDGEPICIDDTAAFGQLSGIADVFLTHDREIVHRCDDSIVRMIADKPRLLRVGRGYAPMSIKYEISHTQSVLAVGGQEKNAFALTTSEHIVLSQHIGDLDRPAAREMLISESSALAKLLGVAPSVAAVDLHPDYQSVVAVRSQMRTLAVQHHHAHALACMFEHNLSGAALAVVWDGTGYGSDQTVWGGEFLRVEGINCARIGHFRAFPLPGGDVAIREPRRSLLGLLFAMYGKLAGTNPSLDATKFSPFELSLLMAAMASKLNAPLTSSMGRLFDAMASILNLCQISLYSEQAGVAVEACAKLAVTGRTYHIAQEHAANGQYVLDWQPMIEATLADVDACVSVAAIALGFHEALVNAVVTLARCVGLHRIVLSGGVFQNALLTSMLEARLRSHGFSVYSQQSVPAGDGGLAIGQAFYALLSQVAEEGEYVPCCSW